MLAQSAGAWEKIEVLEVLPNDLVRIHWVGWGESFDETVPSSSLRSPNNRAKDPAVAASDGPSRSEGPRFGSLPQVKRMWSDATGQFRVKAELVDYKDGQVTLKKEDGSLVTFPEQKLSRSDQAFLRAMTRTAELRSNMPGYDRRGRSRP